MRALCLVLLVPALLFAAGDDAEFKVRMEPKAGNTLPGTDVAYEDLVILKDGKLTSKMLEANGFRPADAARKKAGKAVEITATQPSEKHGVAIWKLRIEGSKVEGTMLWDKKAKKANYDVAGERKE